MKKMMKKLKLVFVIGMIAVPTILMSQGGGGNNLPPVGETDGNGDGYMNDANTPFDGGVSLLVAAGIAYGLKKKYDKKKAQKEEF